MNKFLKGLLGMTVGATIAFACYAETITEKVAGVATGITSNTDENDRSWTRTKEAIIFSSYDFGTTTAVYNGDGDSGAGDGWIDIRDYNDEVTFHVDLDTLGSTGLDVTIEALVSNDTSTPMSIYTKSFSATDTGYSLSIAEGGLKYVRVKGQATGTNGTDSATIKIRAEGEGRW